MGDMREFILFGENLNEYFESFISAIEPIKNPVMLVLIKP